MPSVQIVSSVNNDLKHKGDIQSIALKDGKIYSAGDDGKIKIWSETDLSLLQELQAHDCSILHVALWGDLLFTASVDETIRSFDLKTLKLKNTFQGHEGSVKRLAIQNHFLFSGDDLGIVNKWTFDGNHLVRYETIEEIWDLHVVENLIYSIRDRGLTITQIKDDSNTYSIVHSMEGRGPLYLHENHMAFLDSTGKKIQIHLNQSGSYKQIHEFEGHDLIITALGGNGELLLSGGWDQKVKVWNLSNFRLLGECSIPSCPNSIVVNDFGEAFIAGDDSFLVKLKISEM